MGVPAERPRMSTETLCQICEAEPATHSCGHCGNAACDEHYDDERGLCAQCASSISEDGVDAGGNVETPDLAGDDLDDNTLR